MGADDKLLTRDEAAERLGLSSAESLRRLRRLRRIGFVKVGRRVRFRPGDVEAFIAAHHVPAGERG